MDATPHPLAPQPIPEPPKKGKFGAILLQASIGAVAGAGGTLLALRILPDNDAMSIVLLVVALLLSGWLHILVHEAGHAVAGLSVGMQPLAYGLGPLRFERSGTGWRARWAGGIEGVGGFAALMPRADAPPSLRAQAVYLLGGVAANVVAATIAILAAMTLAEHPWTVIALAAFATMGVVLGVINLVPFESGGWLSDGAALRELRRDPAHALDGLRVQQVVQASMQGVRPRDWSTLLLPGAPLPDPKSASSAAVMAAMLRMSRAIDRDDRAEAEACATLLAAHWPHSKAPFRPGIALAMTSFALTVLDDVALAKAWRPLGVGGVLDQATHDAWMDAEIAVREHRFDDARALLAKAREALPRVHDGGSRTVIAEYLERLSARLDAHAPGAAAATM